MQVLERWTSKALADPLVREAAILAAIQHPNILRYLVRSFWRLYPSIWM